MQIRLITLVAAAVFSVSAYSADFLADRHVARGANCAACHTTQPPKAVPAKQCLTCHGSYEKLAQRTENLDVNPHDSHMGELECTECHKGHKKPQLVCDQCHEFRQLKIR